MRVSGIEGCFSCVVDAVAEPAEVVVAIDQTTLRCGVWKGTVGCGGTDCRARRVELRMGKGHSLYNTCRVKRYAAVAGAGTDLVDEVQKLFPLRRGQQEGLAGRDIEAP